MKNKCAIGLFWAFLLVVLGGCSHEKPAFEVVKAPHHALELRGVSTLMNENPQQALDSVLSLQDSVSKWSEADRNEFLVLYVEALFKNLVLEKDAADLRPAVVYYDSLSEIFPDDEDLNMLRARAYYYEGVLATFRDEDLDAVRCFLQTLNLLKRTGGEGDASRLRFLALTYTRLGEVLYYYGVNDRARVSFAKASEIFGRQNDTLALASMKRSEASIFQAEKNYEVALAKFKEAERLYPVGQDIFNHSLGCMLYDMHQYDSAAYFLEKSFDMGDRFSRIDAAARLAEINRSKGDLEKEVCYTRYYVANALKESDMAAVKMEMEFLCSNFDRENAVAEVAPEKSNATGVVLLLTLVAAVMAILAFVIVRNRRRISHIEEQITTIEENRQKEAEGKDKEMEDMARQLSDTKEQLENLSKTDFEESWKRFNESAICKKIKKSVEGKDIMIKSVTLYPKLKLSRMDTMELVRALNESFEGFSSRLVKDYEGLMPGDVRHCALVLLGLNDAEIAVLEGVSYSGTNRRSNKIQGIMHAEDTLEQTLLVYLKKYW